MARTLLMGLAAAAIPLVSAAAAPATPEEAARLTALFERYVSHPAAGQPSGITVAPEGESYLVTVDLKRAAAGLESFGLTIDPYTSKSMLTPQTDGTWKVHSDDNPPLVMHLGTQTVSFAATSSTYDGVYDSKLRAFTSFAQQQAGTTTTQTTPSGNQIRRIDKVTLSGNGVAAEGGTVTTTAHYAGTGIATDMVFKAPPPSRRGRSRQSRRAAARAARHCHQRDRAERHARRRAGPPAHGRAARPLGLHRRPPDP